MSPSRPRTASALPHAEAVRATANHYNQFNVACVAFTADGEMLTGANEKPTKDSAPVCAEMKVLHEAEKRGIMLDELLVTGHPRPEDTTPTLHCCGERCIPLMWGYYKQGLVIDDKTHLTFVNATTREIEEFELREFFKLKGVLKA